MTKKEKEVIEAENAKLVQDYIKALNQIYLETHPCFVRMHDGYQPKGEII